MQPQRRPNRGGDNPNYGHLLATTKTLGFYGTAAFPQDSCLLHKKGQRSWGHPSFFKLAFIGTNKHLDNRTLIWNLSISKKIVVVGRSRCLYHFHQFDLNS